MSMAEKVAWHDAYPKPRNQSPAILQRQDLLARFQKGDKPGVHFLLVDLRRTDHEVGGNTFSQDMSRAHC